MLTKGKYYSSDRDIAVNVRDVIDEGVEVIIRRGEGMAAGDGFLGGGSVGGDVGEAEGESGAFELMEEAAEFFGVVISRCAWRERTCSRR